MESDIITPLQTYIAYSRGYKYQLKMTAEFLIPLLVPYAGYTSEYVDILDGGVLVIRKGYAWDGASGITIDTRSSMRLSLVHDVLYQLIRLGVLPRSFKAIADKILYFMGVLDEMFRIRAGAWYQAVKHCGGKNTLASNRKQILYAP